MTDLGLQGLMAMAQLIKTKELSPVELTRHMLARIEALDGHLHSYVTVLAEQALAQAAAAEAEIMAGNYRGPLHGIPIAVKDLCFTKGIRTTCGARMLDNWIPDIDATVVTKLAQAGAILLGKLHMTEFALRWHHPYRPVPVNPWHRERWPGVSSSGSGVATAAGLCFGALGTDTGGSIRFPAASNGVVGLKPTYGRVSRHGVFPLAETLDHVGPLTRRVADAAVTLAAIAGADPHDPTARRLAVPDYLAATTQSIQGVRIGVDADFITNGVHPEVSQGVLTALHVLEDLGAELVELSVPEAAESVEAMLETWLTLTACEAAAAHEATFPSQADAYGPFRELLEDGATRRGQEYAKAHIVRERFGNQLQTLFETVDLLACPTMPSTAPKIDAQGNAIMEAGFVRSRFTYPFNFSRNPTLALPCGFASDGLPISLQLVGGHFDEARLCQVGHAYEEATRWYEQVPPLAT